MATYNLVLKVGDNKNVLKKGMTKEEAKALAEEQNRKCEELGLSDHMKAIVTINMNAHERELDRIISCCVSEWIGGYENVLLDYPEDSEEYKEAKEVLQHDALFDAIYRDVMFDTKRNAKSHIRFAGKAFIEDRIETRLKKEGYGARA